MNPYVFVVGCPRSGTTLVQRILDAHPDLAVVNETHWITRSRGAATGLVDERLLDELAAHPRFAKLGVPVAALESFRAQHPDATYADLVAQVFDHYSAARGKRLAGDKTPPYVQKVDVLHRLFPAARIVHVIRDGRSVSLSVRAWAKSHKVRRQFPMWDDDPLLASAIWWARLVLLGREDGRAIGEHAYRDLLYEDLVSDDAGTVRTLCAFLGLRYDEAMLRFHEGRMRDDGALDAKHAWRPVTTGLRDWRRDMPDADVERFEAAAGTLLAELGYERRYPEPAPAAVEAARSLQARVAAHLRDRQRRVPRGW